VRAIVARRGIAGGTRSGKIENDDICFVTQCVHVSLTSEYNIIDGTRSHNWAASLYQPMAVVSNMDGFSLRDAVGRLDDRLVR
jgi:hypothetical protein